MAVFSHFSSWEMIISVLAMLSITYAMQQILCTAF
ncbi:protein of unknown function [Cupriavidus taiwanensis]|nr:protein of unknown function [Cupriavidus taiwanensis]